MFLNLFYGESKRYYATMKTKCKYLHDQSKLPIASHYAISWCPQYVHIMHLLIYSYGFFFWICIVYVLPASSSEETSEKINRYSSKHWTDTISVKSENTNNCSTDFKDAQKSKAQNSLQFDNRKKATKHSFRYSQR